MSPEIIASVQKFLTEKFSYLPQIGEFLVQDFCSSSPKFTQELHNPKILGFIQDSGTVPHTPYRKMCYQLVKIGHVVIIDSPDFKYHGHKIQIDKKKDGCLEGHIVSDSFAQKAGSMPKGEELKLPASVRINSTSYRFIGVPLFINDKSELEQTRKVKIGQLVYIIDPHYRPRYEKYDQFRVVWSGPKYIRVEPVRPKYKTWERTQRIKRIGDATYEINTEVKNGRERTFRYNSSCYSKDIPHFSVITVGERFGSEAEENYQMMADLGL